MPTTTRHALRYPASTASPDVPTDMNNAMSDVDAALPYVTGTTPTSPVAGLVWLQATGAQYYDGSAWHPTYPVVLGSLIQSPAGSDLTSGTPVDQYTISPSISVPTWAQDGTHKLWVKSIVNPAIVTSSGQFFARLAVGGSIADEGSLAGVQFQGGASTQADIVVSGTFTIGSGVSSMAVKVQAWRVSGTGAARFNNSTASSVVRWEWRIS